MENLISLKCEKCGIEYKKPGNYKKWNNEKRNVFFKWSLMFCDSCRRNKEKEAFKRLPSVFEALANNS